MFTNSNSIEISQFFGKNKLRVLIFAGGAGTRLSEETHNRPKPLVTIGNVPILQHIINWYSKFGITQFTALTGYKGHQIFEYFERVSSVYPNLMLEILETGEHTQTGGRLRQALELYPDEQFLLTYGDGVCDVDIAELIEFHNSNKVLVTITAVRPQARFGSLELDGNLVSKFKEKDQLSQSWVNGGYFVIDRRIIGYLSSDDMPFEREPLSQLADRRELAAFKHYGSWFPMDTLRERNELEKIWASGEAPWK